MCDSHEEGHGDIFRVGGTYLLFTHNCGDCLIKNRVYAFKYSRDKYIMNKAAEFVNDHPNEIAFTVKGIFDIFKGYKQDKVPQIDGRDPTK